MLGARPDKLIEFTPFATFVFCGKSCVPAPKVEDVLYCILKVAPVQTLAKVTFTFAVVFVIAEAVKFENVSIVVVKFEVVESTCAALQASLGLA